MSDPALRRTIRRCVALILIPLSLYPMIPIARLDDDGAHYNHLVLEFADEVALIVFVGAVLYLAGSVTGQMLDGLQTEPEPAAPQEE